MEGNLCSDKKTVSDQSITQHDEAILEKWPLFSFLTEGFKRTVESFQVYKYDVYDKGAYMITNRDEVYIVGVPTGFKYIDPNDDYEDTSSSFDIPRKVHVLSRKNIKSISVDDLGGVALSRSGILYVWSRRSELHNLTAVKEVAFSEHHSYCYLTQGNVVYYKSFLNPDFDTKIITPSEEIVAMSCGFEHFALLTINSSVFTFGTEQKLSDSFTSLYPLNEARKVDLPGPCKKVVCTAFRIAFLMCNGDVYYYGEDHDGPLPTKLAMDQLVEDMSVLKYNPYPIGTPFTDFVLMSVSGVIYRFEPDAPGAKPYAVEGITTLVDLNRENVSPQIHLKNTSSFEKDLSSRSSGIRSFFAHTLYCDVFIKLADGSMLPAHKIVLHVTSLTFRENLSTNVTNEDGMIDFERYSPNAVKAYVRKLYGDRMDEKPDPMTMKDLLQIYTFAKRDGNLHLLNRNYVAQKMFAGYLKV